MKITRYVYSRGFTMKEFLIVLGIGAVLLGVLLPNLSDSRRNARDTIRIGYIDQIKLTLEEYKLHCREYPNRLDLTTNNGCSSGLTLGSFISAIPQPQGLDSDLVAGFSGVDPFGVYYYSGITRSSSSGRCFDYHLAIELENEDSTYLQVDHDIEKSNTTRPICSGSEPDFSTDAAADDTRGLYDFRSQLETL